MARRCRELDWSATSLGPPEGWPVALRTIVRTCLETPFPVNLWCGRDLVLIYNDAYRRVLGAKHPRALGRPGLEVWAEIRADVEPMIAQIRAGGAPVYAEDARFIMTRSTETGGESGAEAYFTFALSPVRDDRGEIVALFNPAAETTTRVLMQRRLDALNHALEVERSRLAAVFDQSPSFLAVLRGADNVFELANATYHQIVGQGRKLIGRPLFDAMPETRDQGFDEFLMQVRQTGQPLVFRALPVRLERVAGAPLEERFVDITYLPLVEADGSHDAVIAHGTDVTDQVHATQRVEAARAAAEEANHAKTQFLATMSHELRTPLNAIQGHVQLLTLGVYGELTADQRQTLGRIDRAQRHLLALINEVLGYARLESGRVEYDMQATLVADVVGDVTPLIEPLFSAKRQRFVTTTVDGSPAASIRVLADREKLGQVLVNLVSNAIKFTPEGGEVSVTWSADDAEAVKVCVSDTGIGIPSDKLEAIFEPFVQVRSTYSPGQGGTGLGLAISRDLVRGMGGELTVTSAEGQGSTFAVELRRAESSS
jgi:signal transduction histidine kinase